MAALDEHGARAEPHQLFPLTRHRALIGGEALAEERRRLRQIGRDEIGEGKRELHRAPRPRPRDKSRVPEVEIITGSSTTRRARQRRKPSATAATTSASRQHADLRRRHIEIGIDGVDLPGDEAFGGTS